MQCPCCGSAITNPPDVSAMREVRAGTQTHALLNHLVDIYPKGATLDQLVGQTPHDLAGEGPGDQQIPAGPD